MINRNFNKTIAEILVFTTLLFAGCSKDDGNDDVQLPDPPAVVQSDIKGIDDRLENFLSENNFPGISLAISKDGKLVYQKGYGLANVEGATEVDTTSQFRIASVSKLFTSVAIMKLIQDKKLTIDQPVFGEGGILGTTYGQQPYGTYVTDITIGDLLHHTSGGWGQDNDPAFFDRTLDTDAIIDWTVDNLPLAKAPGTAFAYSNFGYMLLSKIVEKAGARPYAKYVEDEILSKVGAESTFIAGTGLAERQANEVAYYGQEGDTDFVYDYIQFDRAAGAMGWLGTPKDLLLFANAVDGSPTRPDLLDMATIETMTTVTPASMGFGFHFGCGWVVEGDEWFWWGSLPGTFAILYRNANGICIAATANGRRQPSPELALDGFIGVINYIAFDGEIPWQDIDQF